MTENPQKNQNLSESPGNNTSISSASSNKLIPNLKSNDESSSSIPSSSSNTYESLDDSLGIENLEQEYKKLNCNDENYYSND
jgi:hypothetical protein